VSEGGCQCLGGCASGKEREERERRRKRDGPRELEHHRHRGLVPSGEVNARLVARHTGHVCAAGTDRCVSRRSRWSREGGSRRGSDQSALLDPRAHSERRAPATPGERTLNRSEHLGTLLDPLEQRRRLEQVLRVLRRGRPARRQAADVARREAQRGRPGCAAAAAAVRGVGGGAERVERRGSGGEGGLLRR